MAYIASNARLGLVDLSTVTNTIGTPFTAGSQLPSVTLEAQLGETCTGWDPNLGGGEFVYLKVAAAPIVAAQTISSLAISGTTVTITTGSGHSLVPGYSITISGAVPSTYNGTWQLITASASTGTFVIPTNTPTINATTAGSYVVGIGAGQTCELAYSLAAGYVTITATPWTGTTITGKPLAIALNNMQPGYYGWFQWEGIAVAVTNGTVTVGGPLSWQANGTLSTAAIVAGKSLVNGSAASLNTPIVGQGSTAVTYGAFQALVFIDRPCAQSAIT